MINRLDIRFLVLFFAFLFGKSHAQLVSELPDSLQEPALIDTNYVVSLLQYANATLYQDPPKANEVLLRVVHLSDSLSAFALKGKGMYGVGLGYTLLSQPTTAIEWLDSSATQFLDLDDSTRFYNCVFMKAANFDNMGHYNRAMAANSHALKYFRKTDNADMVARITNNVGNLLYHQEQYGPAIEYYQEALEEGRNTGAKMIESVAMANIAFCYAKIDSLEPAEAFYQEVYQFNLENSLTYVHGKVCAEYADLKITQGELDQARELLDESLAKSAEVSDSSGMANAFLIYGRLYRAERNNGKAIEELRRAVDYANRFEDPEVGISARKELNEVYKEQGEFEKAHAAFEDYIELRDSIYGEEKNSELAELTSILDTERKQLELDQLKSEKELQDKVVDQQKWFIGGLGAAFLVAIFFLVMAIVGERRRRAANESLAERNAQIAAQQDEIVAKNNRLEAQNQHLETLNGEMEGLIEIVAHDLKAPISKTRALLEMVDREAADQGTGQVLDMADQVLDNGMELIRDILTIRTVEGTEESSLRESVELNALVQATANPYIGESKSKDIALQLDLPEEPITLKSTPQAIQRILENLLSNALKFSFPGTQVTLALRKTGKQVLISVQDQGPGISAEDQQRMFRKFQRLSARPTGGEHSTGLGLSIVKALSERIGGDIKVESHLGKGALFTLVLPLTAPT